MKSENVTSVKKNDYIFVSGLCSFLKVVSIRNFLGRVIVTTEYKGGYRNFGYDNNVMVEVI